MGKHTNFAFALLMLANHKMAYIEGYNRRNQSKQVAHLYLQTYVLHRFSSKLLIVIVKKKDI